MLASSSNLNSEGQEINVWNSVQNIRFILFLRLSH